MFTFPPFSPFYLVIRRQNNCDNFYCIKLGYCPSAPVVVLEVYFSKSQRDESSHKRETCGTGFSEKHVLLSPSVYLIHMWGWWWHIICGCIHFHLIFFILVLKIFKWRSFCLATGKTLRMWVSGKRWREYENILQSEKNEWLVKWIDITWAVSDFLSLCGRKEKHFGKRESKREREKKGTKKCMANTIPFLLFL